MSEENKTPETPQEQTKPARVKWGDIEYMYQGIPVVLMTAAPSPIVQPTMGTSSSVTQEAEYKEYFVDGLEIGIGTPQPQSGIVLPNMQQPPLIPVVRVFLSKE